MCLLRDPGELGQRVPADRTELGSYAGLGDATEHELLELVSDLLDGLAHHGCAARYRAGAGRDPAHVHGQQTAVLAARQPGGVGSGAQRGPRAVHADHDQRWPVGPEFEVRRWRTHEIIVPTSMIATG